MNRIKFTLNLLFLITIVSLVSCEKTEGPGGNSSIKGRIMVNAYDEQLRVLQDIFPAAEEDVYITYGTGNMISDDALTSSNGYFEFNFLSKGNYKIMVYSDDTLNTSTAKKICMEKDITISGNNEEIDAGEISIYKKLDVNDGHASINGIVKQVNYAEDFLFIIDTTYAQEEPIYLVFEDDSYYSERIRTLNDGTFEFPKLIKGNYKIILYSDNITGRTEKIAITKQIIVKDTDQKIDLGMILIDKETK